MTSKVRLPENWDNIQTMQEDTYAQRGDKVDAIHDFMRENGIDSTDFENQGQLIWPGGARAQRNQIAAMIEAVNSEMTRTREGSSKDDDVEMGEMGERGDIWVASPPPQSMSRQSSLRINVPPQSPQGFPQAFQQGFQQGFQQVERLLMTLD